MLVLLVLLFVPHEAFAAATQSELGALASSLLQQSKPVEAARTFLEATLLHPQFAEAYNGLAVSLHQQDQYNQAAETLARCIDLVPACNVHVVHFNRAKSLRAHGDISAAAGSYSAALSLAPQLAPARLALAELYNNAKHYAAAAEHAAIATGLAPLDPNAYYQLATALRAAPNSAPSSMIARAALETVLTLAPAAPNVYSQLASLLEGSEAIAAYRAALTLEPSLLSAYKENKAKSVCLIDLV